MNLNPFRRRPVNSEQQEAHRADLKGKSDAELRHIVKMGKVELIDQIRLALEFERRAHIIAYHNGDGLPPEPDDEFRSVEEREEDMLKEADSAWKNARELLFDLF